MKEIRKTARKPLEKELMRAGKNGLKKPEAGKKTEKTERKTEKKTGKAAPELLWGGRFQKKPDRAAREFNESFSFDCRLWKQDIRGSIAHVTMLSEQKILSVSDKNRILKGLMSIEKDIEKGKLKFSFDGEFEDIHSFIENTLTERIGSTGKKLHTGRSRNDQVALDMKLYVRDEVDEMDSLLTDLLQEILSLMEKNTETVIPGFTHLQKAQPTTLAHYFGAYFEMFIRDRDRLKDCRVRLNTCPLGSGALAGTTYPLDRDQTAKLLGFDCPAGNSMDAVSDRDYLIELLSDLSLIAMHLSRLSEELIIWNTNEYRYIEMDDSFATGSSIMPQKKNPDIAELIRGKTGRVYGALVGLLTVMKGLPLAYDKDMQEDKEGTFDAIDTVKQSLVLMTGMLSSVHFNKARMEESTKGGYTNATDAADYLVKKGIPFRDAHALSGKLVLLGIREGKSLDDLTLEEFQSVSPVFEKDIFQAISMKTCISKRNTAGAPGPKAMEDAIKTYREKIGKRT